MSSILKTLLSYILFPPFILEEGKSCPVTSYCSETEVPINLPLIFKTFLLKIIVIIIPTTCYQGTSFPHPCGETYSCIPEYNILILPVTYMVNIEKNRKELVRYYGHLKKTVMQYLYSFLLIQTSFQSGELSTRKRLYILPQLLELSLFYIGKHVSCFSYSSSPFGVSEYTLYSFLITLLTILIFWQ